jgi:sugar lactone lactonase YvrE
MVFAKACRGGFICLGLLLAAGISSPARAESLTITTVAGAVDSPGAIDGSLSAARFSSPDGVAVDSSGNLYVADTVNNIIRKITSAGVVTTLAGLAGITGSADGTGISARFNGPEALAVDSSGNVYVSDSGNFTIRKITPGGVVTTLAGTAGSSGSVDDTGSAARFAYPLGVAVDGSGNVYVADMYNQTIRMISPAGVVTTFAGTAGVSGSADDTGTAATFNYPSGVAVDGSGNLYVADRFNSTIRKITSAGVVGTLAGTAGNTGSADDTGTAATFNYPSGVAVDGSGNIYVADSSNNTIRMVTPAGVVTTPAGTAGTYGSADGTGGAAQFYNPMGVAVDGSGNVYVGDANNNAIRQITPDAVVTTLAGIPGGLGHADGTASAAQFLGPTSVAVDSSGNCYVADFNSNTIRKITAAGVVTTLAGTPGVQGSADGTGAAAQFYLPQGVAVDGTGNVYVSDYGNNTIRKISPAGDVMTLAGTAGIYGHADDTGTAASFGAPAGIAVDSSGNVYVAEWGNNAIRMITPAGVVTTFAGQTNPTGGFVDGTGTAALFSGPYGMAIDSAGNLYVADVGNNAIRVITPAAVVSTLAGAGPGIKGSADGTGSAAQFNNPNGVAVDGSGNVYVGDSYNHTIRKVTPAGAVTTVAGSVGTHGKADGTGSNALLYYPSGMTVDGSGNLYIADDGNGLIRKGVPAIDDVATINGSTGSGSGAVGSVQQLDTSPQTATSWQWSTVRNPGGSTAALSSTTVRNPTFTPDIADVWVFQLLATDASGHTSLSFIHFTGNPAAAARPTFSLASGTYVGSQSVTISCTTPGATIYYTTDGTTPDSSSPQYSTPINVTASLTIATYAAHAGMYNSSTAYGNYYIKVEIPTFTPVAGTYSNAQSVTISCATNGATIYYTTDGLIPSNSSPQYSAPINVATNMTVQAYAVSAGLYDSDVGSATYNITSSATVATPTFSPAAGTYSAAQSVSIACTTSGATIYYTTDGSTPTMSSPQYSSPISVTSSRTLKAYACHAGMSSSAVATAAYTIMTTVATPTFNPAAGIYSNAQSVTISSTTAGATIYYTTDGSTPTMSSPQYSSPISVASNTTLKAYACHAGMNNSAVASATYTFGSPPAITSATSATGLNGNSFSYTITATKNPTSFSASALPAGLSLDSASGAITGTPTAAGVTKVTINAFNAYGCGSATLNIDIGAQGPAITFVNASMNPVFFGQDTSLWAEATNPNNGTLTFTWDYGDGTATETGDVIYHYHSAPVSGQYVGTVTVSDGKYSSQPWQFVIIVEAPDSGGEGIQNGLDALGAVVNSLNSISQSLQSDGDLVKLFIDLTGFIPRSSYDVSTEFSLPSRSSATISGTYAVAKLNEPSVYVANSSVCDKGTANVRGRARLTIPMSNREVGLPVNYKAEPSSYGITCTSMKGKFGFSAAAKAKGDSVSLSTTVELPEGLDVSKEQELTIGIGNVLDHVIVDSHGKGKSTGDNGLLKQVTIKYPKVDKTTKLTAGTPDKRIAKIGVTLNAKELTARGFDTEGVDPTMDGKPLQIQAAFVLAGVAYQTRVPASLKVTPKKDAGAISLGRR